MNFGPELQKKRTFKDEIAKMRNCLTKFSRIFGCGAPGRAASEREEHKRKRYPPEKNPHAKLTPFVVEARGRLGSEVLSFLKQHAPAEESLRSVVLASARREISIVTQRGLAALLLAAEPRPAAA